LVNARNTYAIITISAFNALIAFLTLITFNSCWALLTVIAPWTLRSLRAGFTLWAALTSRASNLYGVANLSASNLASYKLKDFD
jgi:1,4-dihydroxy-2-naphthoate octaprenyltransferase